MVQKELLRVLRESDLEDDVIGRPVKVSLDGLKTIRRMVYEGVSGDFGGESFLEYKEIDKVPIIYSWRSEAKYLQFGDKEYGSDRGFDPEGVVIFNTIHYNIAVYNNGTVSYENAKRLLDEAA